MTAPHTPRRPRALVALQPLCPQCGALFARPLQDPGETDDAYRVRLLRPTVQTCSVCPAYGTQPWTGDVIHYRQEI